MSDIGYNSAFLKLKSKGDDAVEHMEGYKVEKYSHHLFVDQTVAESYATIMTILEEIGRGTVSEQDAVEHIKSLFIHLDNDFSQFM